MCELFMMTETAKDKEVVFAYISAFTYIIRMAHYY